MAYVVSAVSSLFSLAPYVAAVGQKETAPKGQYLDLGAVILKLAILSFRGGTTKLRMAEKDFNLYNDHDHGLFLQSMRRTWEGSGGAELVYLLNPLYQAITVLKPGQDPRFKPIFELALKGLNQLADEAYKDPSKFATQTLLKNAHIRLLNDALEGKEINPGDFNITPWSREHGLAATSEKVWSVSFVKLGQFVGCFQRAQRHLEAREDREVEAELEKVKRGLDKILNQIRDAESAWKEGREPSFSRGSVGEDEEKLDAPEYASRDRADRAQAQAEEDGIIGQGDD